MHKEKQFILIVDDENKVTKEFKENHGNEYRIESINYTNIETIKNELLTTYSDNNKPDFILTDLKHEVKDTALGDLKN